MIIVDSPAGYIGRINRLSPIIQPKEPEEIGRRFNATVKDNTTSARAQAPPPPNDKSDYDFAAVKNHLPPIFHATTLPSTNQQKRKRSDSAS